MMSVLGQKEREVADVHARVRKETEERFRRLYPKSESFRTKKFLESLRGYKGGGLVEVPIELWRQVVGD